MARYISQQAHFFGRPQRQNPSLGHAKKERVSLFGTDQRITSWPAARRPHSKAKYMTAPERFADSLAGC